VICRNLNLVRAQAETYSSQWSHSQISIIKWHHTSNQQM